MIGTLLLAFALLAGVSALCRATKSKPPGMTVRGNFVTETEMGAARKAAQARSEPGAKWRVAAAANFLLATTADS